MTEGARIAYPCKRDGCTSEVVYSEMIVPAFARRRKERSTGPRTVYLRCDAGHVHPYVIEPQKK